MLLETGRQVEPLLLSGTRSIPPTPVDMVADMDVDKVADKVADMVGRQVEEEPLLLSGTHSIPSTPASGQLEAKQSTREFLFKGVQALFK